MRRRGRMFCTAWKFRENAAPARIGYAMTPRIWRLALLVTENEKTDYKIDTYLTEQMRVIKQLRKGKRNEHNTTSYA